MSEAPKIRPVARVYIREWMEARDGIDQKSLAKKMGRSEGAMSKKLKEPWRIDVQWLSEFAAALGVSVSDLFRAPQAGMTDSVEILVPRPQVADLLALANKMTDGQIEGLIALFPHLQDDAPPEEHIPASAAAPRPKAPEAQ